MKDKTDYNEAYKVWKRMFDGMKYRPYDMPEYEYINEMNKRFKECYPELWEQMENILTS